MPIYEYECTKCGHYLEALQKIADKPLRECPECGKHALKRLADRDIALELDDTARDRLGEAGFDPVYGARPLKRAIQQQLENPLAQRILRGDFAPGVTVHVTVKDGALAFERRLTKAAAA